MTVLTFITRSALAAWRPAVTAWLAGCWIASATAASGIYICVDANGKRLTSDRPIGECLDRVQRVLNKDGSQRAVLGPRVTARERAEREEVQRQQALAEQTHKDAVRRDRNLLQRYPTEAVHHAARQAALDDLRKAMAGSQKRITELMAERKKLVADAEFYKGKPLPFKLRSSLEGNEATQQAQQDIIENHKAEMVRITALYDVELARLRKLWAGVEPGSIKEDVSQAAAAGVITPPASASAVR